jgi:hypothetical protein
VNGRRGLVTAVLLCAAGSVLALVAAGRTWAVAVTARPAPLPDLIVEHSGGDLRPWLPALAWLALAGAAALPATRGAVRRLVGGLLVTAAAAIVVGAGTAATVGGAGWPALAAAGGLAVAAAGGLAGRQSPRWPAMGARFERTARSGRDTPDPRQAAPEHLWNALDRGEDPTD